jgi:group I intron endonuclease
MIRGVALTRETFDESTRTLLLEARAGVYAIRQISTSRLYIGSSKKLYDRLRHHFYELRKGVHHSRFLQRAWDKHSSADFEWAVLQKLPPGFTKEDQQKLEDFWIEETQCFRPSLGFNSTTSTRISDLSAEARERVLKMHRTPEMRAKHAAIARGKHPEWRNEIGRLAMKKKFAENPDYKNRMMKLFHPPGKKLSAKQREKISIAGKGRKLSPEVCKHLSERQKQAWADPLYRESQSASLRGRTMPPSSRKGKSFIELYGEEKASLVREKCSVSWFPKGRLSPNKGKTFIELYGEEKALRIGRNHSLKITGRKHTPEEIEKMRIAMTGKKRLKPSYRKGKSYVEIYGTERAEQEKQKRILGHLRRKTT